MFLSVILPLTALDTLDQPVFLGREAHALWLRLIQGSAPALADKLHMDEQRKPFTVSGLRREPHASSANAGAQVGFERRSVARIGTICAGDRFSLRFTALTAQLSKVLLESVLPRLPETVRLGPAHFESGAAVYQSEQHPWAGQGSAEELTAKWLCRGSAPPRRIELEFASPTMIKRQGRILVMPIPSTVFQSYLMAWNAYASPPLESDLVDLVERDVLVTRYELRTQSVPLSTPPVSDSEKGEEEEPTSAHQIGFVGRCAFTCFSQERVLWRALHLLADFAFFCGTGYKTTQGMGQTRQLGGQSNGTR